MSYHTIDRTGQVSGPMDYKGIIQIGMCQDWDRSGQGGGEGEGEGGGEGGRQIRDQLIDRGGGRGEEGDRPRVKRENIGGKHNKEQILVGVRQYNDV